MERTDLPSSPLIQWQNCSMFMVATEPLPSGFSNESVTIGEQLNTPGPEKVCNFEYGRFENLGTTEAKVNLTNVFSTSITKRNEEDCNNSSSDTCMHDKMKEYPFEMEYSNGNNPMTPPSSVKKEPSMSHEFKCWELESCLEEVLLSPASYINTPLGSIGVASPGSVSGDTEQKQTDELETCIDFNTIAGGSEDELSIPLHEEIEQLSNSFYCKSNNLVSVKVNSANGADAVSPSFLQLLEKESIFSVSEGNPSVTSGTVNNEKTSPVADKNLFKIQPSIVNAFFSDSYDDDDDDLEKHNPELENKEQDKQMQNLTVAEARPQAALYDISNGDKTFNITTTQTQLEHNYTIKLPFENGKSHHLLSKTTVKEENLSQLFKARGPQASIPQKPPAVRRNLFQRINNKMSEDNRKHHIPELKLIIQPAGGMNMIATTQMIVNTPELTNDLLDLEAEVLKKEDEFDLLTYINSGTDYDVIAKSPAEEKPAVLFHESEDNVDEPLPTTSVEPKPRSTICDATLSDLFNPAKRKLPTITINDIDQLTISTNNSNKRFRGRSAATSAASSVCGDNASEASSSVRPVKRRGRPPKTSSSIRDRSEYQHLSEADMRYREQRDKNNEASRKSRINRKDREHKLEDEAQQLNRQHELLVKEEQQLIKECDRWRKAVMRLALL
ncbi:uncharacterized protein LOC128740725 [Sabethes cyaneus]|uniref:uncharacterized protein LOC128740725 n=1 Tax=Sabethes cyaneus TaxID=53552 RepID=UPI00237DCBB9|nr:uncharacterized protein LOC128740725 [Sabethes cyaneus]XP_053692366.1 uncharacterized protein LOC128740725 [Sabethes cyaneus]